MEILGKDSLEFQHPKELPLSETLQDLQGLR